LYGFYEHLNAHSQAFLKYLHQPLGLTLPATALQEEGGLNMVQPAQRWLSLDFGR
jgi:hypothetical protein